MTNKEYMEALRNNFSGLPKANPAQAAAGLSDDELEAELRRRKARGR